MKKIVVLSNYLFLASMLLCFVASMSCGGTDDGDNVFDVGEYTPGPVCGDGVCEAGEIGHCTVDCEGDTDVSSEADDAKEDASEPVCGDGICEDEWSCVDDCGTDHDMRQPEQETGNEDIAGCPLGCECCADYDCACVEWPQVVEYMWLVRTWELIEVDGKPPLEEEIVDVEIFAWDDIIQGAEVHGFSPYGPPFPYLRFKKNLISGQFDAINPETKQVVGYGDQVTWTVEYDSKVGDGITHHNVWKKSE